MSDEFHFQKKGSWDSTCPRFKKLTSLYLPWWHHEQKYEMAVCQFEGKKIHPFFLNGGSVDGNVLYVLVKITGPSGCLNWLGLRFVGFWCLCLEIAVGDFFVDLMSSTPLKTNMSPENQWLEDVFPAEKVPFWGTFPPKTSSRLAFGHCEEYVLSDPQNPPVWMIWFEYWFAVCIGP